LNLPDVSEYTTTGRQDADIQSKVGELEVLNQSLRNRDKLKDDAISQLSDQPIPSLARIPLPISWLHTLSCCYLRINISRYQS
jgi:hypothetical protein